MDSGLLAELATLVGGARRITVFTGAGISTAAGIPDFRGPDGLYARVEAEYGLPWPEAIFDIGYFRTRPEPFFRFSRELFAQDVRPTLAHRYLATLEGQGKAIRIVTQNIDMLHEKAGSGDVLACHGSYRTARCLGCGRAYGHDDFAPALVAGTVCRCGCGGVIKPDIVFFGERLPDEFYALLEHPPETDLLLVLGTSLTVQPACLFPLRVLEEWRVPAILVNREPTPYDRAFDHVVHEDIDQVCRELGG